MLQFSFHSFPLLSRCISRTNSLKKSGDFLYYKGWEGSDWTLCIFFGNRKYDLWERNKNLRKPLNKLFNFQIELI